MEVMCLLTEVILLQRQAAQYLLCLAKVLENRVDWYQYGSLIDEYPNFKTKKRTIRIPYQTCKKRLIGMHILIQTY